ncbi:MAG: class I SAM-dependent methyltransferase [bacterium]|nr:class I SAM-dependent methyltransferase [bacterium]
MKEFAKRLFRGLGFDIVRRGSVPSDLRRIRSDFTAEELALVQEVSPHTQTGPERILALVRAVEYVVANGIPGAIVECGVWKGGSMLAATKTLSRLGVSDRELYLFDTFQGLTAPGEQDVSLWGTDASAEYRKFEDEAEAGPDIFALNIAPREGVENLMRGSGYPWEKFHFIEGKVEDTLPAAAPERIALLRLDTDWYESTRHEMLHLFPRLAKGGVLILDDYGEWLGARRAVDEYLAEHKVPMLLNRIDYTGRVGVKLE